MKKRYKVKIYDKIKSPYYDTYWLAWGVWDSCINDFVNNWAEWQGPWWSFDKKEAEELANYFNKVEGGM